MQTKFCYKCKQYKDVNEFYKNKSKKDGLASGCKSCTKQSDKEYHLHNRNTRLKMMREYQEKNRDVLRIKGIKYSRSEKGRELNKAACKKYYWKHRNLIAQRMKESKLQEPKKYKSRYQFCNAVKLGKITRPTHCQMCNKEALVHGHHEDYDKPFEVIWVCSGCHGIIHRKEHTNV